VSKTYLNSAGLRPHGKFASCPVSFVSSFLMLMHPSSPPVPFPLRDSSPLTWGRVALMVLTPFFQVGDLSPPNKQKKITVGFIFWVASSCYPCGFPAPLGCSPPRLFLLIVQFVRVFFGFLLCEVPQECKPSKRLTASRFPY